MISFHIFIARSWFSGRRLREERDVALSNAIICASLLYLTRFFSQLRSFLCICNAHTNSLLSPSSHGARSLRNRIFQKRRMITGQSGNLAFQYLTP